MASIETFLRLKASERARVYKMLSDEERTALLQQLEFVKQNPWLRYQGDPVRFVEEGLGETIWGKQREILQSLMANQRTAVPACHAPGKTHIAARAVAYWVACHPPGTAKVLTTATAFRQVENVMWPHIRRLQARHMPDVGYTNTVQWRVGTPSEAVAEGFKPPDDDEAATQGTHAPNLLIVVDEAGGIKYNFGQNLESLMTGGNTRMLVLGNPPTDQEQTWFEQICESPRYNTIRISAFDTPAYTKEKTGLCHSCPQGVPPHEVVTHLVDDTWVEGVRESFGEGSPYWLARVEAKFPRDNSSKAIPLGWLEKSVQADREEPAVRRVSLGVDIASDGGDEFCIAKQDGWDVTMEHARAGKENEEAMHVAGVILTHIRQAEELHRRRGIKDPVRVKIDAIGVGWGVAGILSAWQRERRFKAEIVPVNVSEKARDAKKFVNQRAELWWNLRMMVQPVEGAPATPLHLAVDTKELAQLNGPTYAVDSSGRILIEKKADMKKRGVHSPDRAEAILLAVYEPPKKAEPATPINLGQVNIWAALGDTNLPSAYS